MKNELSKLALAGYILLAGFAFTILGRFIAKDVFLQAIPNVLGQILIVLGVCLWTYGMMRYAEQKGYNKWIGLAGMTTFMGGFLGFLGCIGVMILIKIPNKTEQSFLQGENKRWFALFYLAMLILLGFTGFYFFSPYGSISKLTRTVPKEPVTESQQQPDPQQTPSETPYVPESPPVRVVAPLDPLAHSEIQKLLGTVDARFQTNQNPATWAAYTHPDGIYTIKYHPALKPTIIPDLYPESDYETVKFEPIEKKSFLDFCESCVQDYPFGQEDFYLSLSFDKGGGGSLCANSTCYNIHDYVDNLDEISLDVFEDYGGVEERLRGIGALYIELGLFYEPVENSIYMGRIYSHYSSSLQRKVVKNMVESIVFDKGKFERIE